MFISSHKTKIFNNHCCKYFGYAILHSHSVIMSFTECVEIKINAIKTRNFQKVMSSSSVEFVLYNSKLTLNSFKRLESSIVVLERYTIAFGSSGANCRFFIWVPGLSHK